MTKETTTQFQYLGLDEGCPVCQQHVDDCDCTECPECAATGDPVCFAAHDMEMAGDSLQALCNAIGIEPVSEALRAVDKHNVEHVWLVFHTGERVYYHDRKRMAELDKEPWLRLKAIGVGGIAWDCSDWEWGEEGRLEELALMRQAFHAALAVTAQDA